MRSGRPFDTLNVDLWRERIADNGLREGMSEEAQRLRDIMVEAGWTFRSGSWSKPGVGSVLLLTLCSDPPAVLRGFGQHETAAKVEEMYRDLAAKKGR